ncbi:hypothetical protein ACJX0J_031257, partial [Zea mays]
ISIEWMGNFLHIVGVFHRGSFYKYYMDRTLSPDKTPAKTYVRVDDERDDPHDRTRRAIFIIAPYIAAELIIYRKKKHNMFSQLLYVNKLETILRSYIHSVAAKMMHELQTCTD